VWAWQGNRIAVRFAYEWHDDSNNWFRSYGNENWEFAENGLMQKRFASINDLPTYVAIPAFAISEFRKSFEMGCLLFIPFLVVDLVISGILLAAGMMMLPPAMISLPFKIILFVLVDGWKLLATTLVGSFNY